MNELETMTITRGLATLKLLEKRIEKAINGAQFVTFKIGDKTQVEIDPKASLQKVKDLIARREKIKTAIMLSNASTPITVAGKTMTVIEAIEYKKSILFEQYLLRKLRDVRNEVADHVEDVNVDSQRRLDRLLEASMGSDTDTKEQKAIVDSFEKRNKAAVVDVLGLDEIIETMGTDIDEFESEVDLCLSESNSVTTIKI